MKALTKTELIIIYNLTKDYLKANPTVASKAEIRSLHKKASAELTFRGAFL